MRRFNAAVASLGVMVAGLMGAAVTGCEGDTRATATAEPEKGAQGSAAKSQIQKPKGRVEIIEAPDEDDTAGLVRRELARAKADGRTLLVYVGATWCEPCKAAVPALLAFAKERGTPVVAITDEGAEQLDTFFASWKGAFPEIVVSDEPRRSQNDYGISGTPTFVLIDDAGRIRRMRSGYSEAIGLSFLKLE